MDSIPILCICTTNDTMLNFGINANANAMCEQRVRIRTPACNSFICDLEMAVIVKLTEIRVKYYEIRNSNDILLLVILVAVV